MPPSVGQSENLCLVPVPRLEAQCERSPEAVGLRRILDVQVLSRLDSTKQNNPACTPLPSAPLHATLRERYASFADQFLEIAVGQTSRERDVALLLGVFLRQIAIKR